MDEKQYLGWESNVESYDFYDGDVIYVKGNCLYIWVDDEIGGGRIYLETEFTPEDMHRLKNAEIDMRSAITTLAKRWAFLTDDWSQELMGINNPALLPATGEFLPA